MAQPQNTTPLSLDALATEQGAPCIRDTAAGAAYDVCGNECITIPAKWPLARPQLATHSERVQRVELRLGFAWWIQRQQIKEGLTVLPPCTWCGRPTGCFCDDCTEGIRNAVCTKCDDLLGTCRPCHSFSKPVSTDTEHAVHAALLRTMLQEYLETHPCHKR